MTSTRLQEAAEVFRWVLDVQSEWPSSEFIKPGRDAASLWALENNNERILGLIPAHERTKILRFYHVRDAKLSLGSQLLKHSAITQYCQVPWSDSAISKDSNHKPCYISQDGSVKHLEFNVSHHGSLVALAGCTARDMQIGIDVVQIDAAKDIPKVRQEGWLSWVNTFEAVFSAAEMRDIAFWEPHESSSEDDRLKAKLRHFYAHWCLKEAYVKMTGEALMASWLQDMEFRNVQVPRAASDLSDNPPDDPWGEKFDGVEIWRHGVRVSGAKIELQAFRDEFPQALLRASKAFLKRSPLPQVAPPEIAALIEALDCDTRNVCRQLDDIAFQTVYAFLWNAQPDLTYERGHFLFVVSIMALPPSHRTHSAQDSLHPSHAKTLEEKRVLVTRKETLGASVLRQLINAFLDLSKTSRVRRWMFAQPLTRCRSAFGKAILQSSDEIQRLVAGRIIHEMVSRRDAGVLRKDFWPANISPATIRGFPINKASESQWSTDFVKYMDDLDSQNIFTQRFVV
ncbi:MAG: hypothetical protein Q9183_003319 [Haloplaca sp. 2 TL-2023]